MPKDEIVVLSSCELLEDFQRWQRESYLKEISLCLHDLSSHLHVATYCLSELKGPQETQREEVLQQKLEKSVGQLEKELSERRKNVRIRRENSTPIISEWERYFSSFFRVTDSFGGEHQPIVVDMSALVKGHERRLLSSTYLPLMTGLQSVAKSLGGQLSDFLLPQSERDIDFRLSLSLAPMGDSQILGLEFFCGADELSQPMMDFFKEFCAKNATMKTYRVRIFEEMAKGQVEKLVTQNLEQLPNGGFKGVLQYS